MATVKEVIKTVEAAFPPRYQEDFDNTGLQVGPAAGECTGVMLCVDATPEIVDEAAARGCNLLLTHHPLIFRPLKRISDRNRVDITARRAIKADVAVYSCHTSVDNAPQTGISWEMARMLGLADVKALECKGPEKIGCGAVGNLPEPMSAEAFIAKVKIVFGSPVARCSSLTLAPKVIERVGLCGGAGNFLIGDAIAEGAQAYICSDCKHNDFIDNVDRVLLVDIGHYESEKCSKEIFRRLLSAKYPDLPVFFPQSEQNPINYI